jgi:hypothetical protein
MSDLFDRDKERKERLVGLQACCRYFQRCISDNKFFEPEFEVSKRVNSILETSPELTRSDVAEVLDLVNSLLTQEHYDGSGWHDYEIQLRGYLKFQGYHTETSDRHIHLISITQ